MPGLAPLYGQGKIRNADFCAMNLAKERKGQGKIAQRRGGDSCKISDRFAQGNAVTFTQTVNRICIIDRANICV